MYAAEFKTIFYKITGVFSLVFTLLYGNTKRLPTVNKHKYL